MQLNQNQLPTYLGNQSKKLLTARFYWLNCEDGYLLQETAQLIKAYLKTHGFDESCERIIFHLDNATDWVSIINCIETPSLFNFSNKQIIEIHFIDKINADAQQQLIKLAQILQNNNSTICLVFYPFRIESQVLKQKWMGTLDKSGVIVTIWPPSITEYPRWVRAQLQKYQIAFTDNNLLDYFCQKTMCNPNMTAQTLYKLKLQNINQVGLAQKDLFLAVLAEHANYDIFDLVNGYLAGQFKQCLIILKILQAHDTEPLLILWALRKELYTLAEIFEQSKQTKVPPTEVLRDLKLWASKTQTLSQALTHFNLELIYKSLQKISELEPLVKTENNPEFIWQQIYELLLLNKVKLAAPLI